MPADAPLDLAKARRFAQEARAHNHDDLNGCADWIEALADALERARAELLATENALEDVRLGSAARWPLHEVAAHAMALWRNASDAARKEADGYRRGLAAARRGWPRGPFVPPPPMTDEQKNMLEVCGWREQDIAKGYKAGLDAARARLAEWLETNCKSGWSGHWSEVLAEIDAMLDPAAKEDGK